MKARKRGPIPASAKPFVLYLERLGWCHSSSQESCFVHSVLCDLVLHIPLELLRGIFRLLSVAWEVSARHLWYQTLALKCWG